MVNPESMNAEQGRTELSPREKEDFIRIALQKVAQYTFPFVCSVIGVSSEYTGRHCGSALRCIVNGRRAILTALHVLQEARREPGGLAISTGYGNRPYLIQEEFLFNEIADWAALFLPADYPNTSFWSREQVDPSMDRLTTDYLFTHGFPGEESYSSIHLQGIVSRSLPYGTMQRLEPLPQEMRPFEFALEYDPDDMARRTGQASKLFNPHGLSGSPVWRIGIGGRSASEWKVEDCLLVGLLTRWHQNERIVIATSIREIPEFTKKERKPPSS